MISNLDPVRIKRILIFTLSNIGDVILNTPVVSLLREHYPSSSITVLVGPKGAPIFTGSNTINEVMIFDKQAPWFQKLALVFALRRKKFDLVVDLRNTAIPFLIGAKHSTSCFVDRTALSMRERHLDRVRFLIIPSPLPPSQSRQGLNPAYLRGEGKGEGVQNLFDFYSEAEKKSAFNKMKMKLHDAEENHFIILAPGAGSSLKRWTISGFSEVLNYFLLKNKTVVLLGWDLERDLGAHLEQKASRPVANLMGALSLRESAALIGGASLVVANDSAVMHLAHELNRPTVSIFGPTNPKKYGRTGDHFRTVRLHLECSPCELSQCPLARRFCLDDLPAASVIEACEELLAHETYSSIKH